MPAHNSQGREVRLRARIVDTAITENTVVDGLENAPAALLGLFREAPTSEPIARRVEEGRAL